MSFQLRYTSTISKCALAVLSVVAEVRAEPTAADKALAVTLFRDGKALMDAGNLAAACPKLEESQRLDPGGGTLLNLALCHEKNGRTATAWAEFVEALGLARRDHRDGRVQFAEEHIAALEKQLSTIKLVVSEESDDPELQLRRDGAIVGRAAWGTDIPADPGDHTIEATAPGKKPWKVVVSLGARGSDGGPEHALTVNVPLLEKSDTVDALVTEAPSTTARTSSIALAPMTASGAPSPARPMSGDPGRQPTGHAQRTWGYVSLGVGLAGLGAGTVLGMLALDRKSASDDGCGGGACTPQAVEQNQDAGRFADFATAGFAVGATGTLLGAVLLLSDSSDEGTAGAMTVVPVARSGGAELDVTGRF